MRFACFLVVFISFFTLQGMGQTIVGSDNAGNYSTWSGGDNQGSGFGVWNLTTSGGGSSGFYLGNSSGQGFGDINTSGKSFSMYANPNGGNSANAERFVTDWANGYSFEIDLAIAYTNGNKGIDIYATGSEVVFTFNVEATDQYRAQGVDLGWAYSQTSIIHLTAIQYPSHLNIRLTRGAESYSTSIPNKEFSGFKVFIADTDGGGIDLNNIHFNNLVVSSSPILLLDDFNRDNNSLVGSPSSGVPETYIETEENSSSGARIEGSHLRLSGEGVTGGREMAALDMTDVFPVAFDASTEEMRWAFNMRSNNNSPSGFNSGDYGSAFVLGSNRADFTANDAIGYAVVLGNELSPDSIRLVRFQNGLILNSNIETITGFEPDSPNSFLSIQVSYNSCDQSWDIIARDSTVFTNPSSGSFTLSATGQDSSYTSTELPFLGALWNHGINTDYLQIDNIYIPNDLPSSNIEYIWTGGTTNFNTPSNWTPFRDCARSRDRLVFDGGTSFITEIPDQSIGQLILRNNATVTFRNQTTGVISRLTLTGGSGQDLLVESGSTLNLDIKNTDNANGIEVEMLPATTGEIFGTFRFANSTSIPGGRPHQLLVNDSDALHVKDGGRVEALQLLLTNHPFGDSGNENTVVFESGSTYLHAFGAHPFGFAQPASKVIFESGSLYHYTATSTPSMSGRNYANFAYDVNTVRDLTGSSNYFIDTLIIDQGTLTFELDAIGTIAGDITVASGASLGFNPPSAGSVLIDAPVIQNISGAGSMTIGANATLNLANQNRINLQKNITIDGAANVLPNAVVDFEGENRFTGTGSTIIQNNSTVYLGSIGGIASAGSTGNIRTSLRTFSSQAAYIYDGTTNQITGTGLPVTLTMSGSLEIDNPGNTVTLTNAGTTTTPLLTLTNGLFSVGTTNTVAILNNGNLNSTSGNFAAGNLAGTVIFEGDGNVSATDDLDFWNVDLPAGSGGVNFGAAGTPNIQNELVISAGRSVLTNGPFYADGSTLVYNTGSEFIASSEWYGASDVDGRGIPDNVQIGRAGVNNSALAFGAASSSRYCTGNIQIGDGVGSGYELTLSSQSGGDLKLDGDFILNANSDFTPNSRAVYFWGSTDQIIRSFAAGNEITFDYIVVNKPSGNLLLSNTPVTTVNANGSSGGNVLVLSNGDLDLQGQTFNLGGSGPFLLVNGGDRNVISSTPASFNVIGQKEVISSNSGALVFDNQVIVNISDGMNFGNDLTLINATLQINSGGFANNNAPRYGPNGILKYNTGGTYERRVEWNGIEGSPGYPNDVIVANSTTLAAGGDGGESTNSPFGARRDVTIEAGSSIYMDFDGFNMTVPLVVGRDLTINGELSASNTIGGDIEVGRNWVRSSSGNFYPKERQVLFNGSTPQTITADGGEIFDYLGFENAGTKELLSDITVNRNIDFFAGTGTLSGVGQTIHLLGDWNNEAGEVAFAEANTTVSFDGSALQNVNCEIGGFEGFHNLTVNNTGEGVLLNNNANIYGNLDFVDGLIDATANRVDFQVGSSNSGAGQNSYINGFASKTGFTSGVEFLFPVGEFDELNAIDVFQPAGLVASATNAAARFTVDYNHENYFPGTFDPNNLPPMQAPLEKVSTCNFWNINRNTAGTDARVRLYWTMDCLDITMPTYLEVAKVVGGEWVSQGYNGSSTSVPFAEGYVESDMVNSFSPFAIGSTDFINVLPIQLLSFTASANGQVVDTRWVTSTETNNDYFTVERSLDAENFEEVGRVEGAGNSTYEMEYSFSDDAPYSGISYYRLKQTDFDGTLTYSEIRAVEIAGDNGFELLKVYRGEDAVNLVYRSEVAMLTVEVFDLLGKRIFVDQIRNENGQNRIDPSLVRGMYLLRLSNGVEVVSEKFFY